MVLLQVMMTSNNQTTCERASSSTMQPVTQLVEASDPIASNESQQVTQWVDDAGMQSASLPSSVVPDLTVLAPGMESRSHNIIDILERPVKIKDYDWTDMLTFDSKLIDPPLEFPTALINAAPNIANKINHFTFFRAHIVVRFVVNANPFQAGRLLAYFAPYSQSTDIGERTQYNDFMSSRSVFPRVVLDASAGNSGELTIPYVSYFSHYDLVRGLGDMGTIHCHVLNPLQDGNATLTVFARFTNISLEIPTALTNNLGDFSTIVNDLSTFTSQNVSVNKVQLRNHIRKSLNDFVPRAQVGEAVAMAKSGTISGVLQNVANISSMATILPVVGPFLQPVSWIAQASSQVASFFGYCKPSNLVPTNKFVQIPGYGFTNSDGIDNGLVLATSCENELGARSDLFGSSLDEMDISHIVSHESYMTGFSWNSTTNTPGTELFRCPVAPGTMDSTLISARPVYNSTALGYISSMFKYWRGSVKLKIQITKTAYHSGRLRISFIPGARLDSTTFDLNQGYSEIVDLRTSDEVEFSIPFVSNTLWKPSRLLAYDTATEAEAYTGIILVTVLNQLRHPDTVTSSLACNVWISGGSDMQFAIPDFQNYVPCQTVSAPQIQKRRLQRSSLPRAQVLGNFQDTGFNSVMQNDNQMFTAPTTGMVDANALSIGEHVQNLRALIRRFGYVFNGTIGPGNSNVLSIHSGYFGTLPYAGSGGSVQEVSGMCPLYYVSWLYRFGRGGMRYKTVNQPTSNADATQSTIAVVTRPGIALSPFAPFVDASPNSNYVALLHRGGTFSHVVSSVYNRICEITVPYFNNTPISLIRGINSVVSASDDRSTVSYVGSDHDDKVTLMQAAGDDFSFGWLVGPPKLIQQPYPTFSLGVNFNVVDQVPKNIGTDTYSIRFDPYIPTPATPTLGTYTCLNIDTFVTVYNVINGSATLNMADVTLSYVTNRFILDIEPREIGNPSVIYDAALTLPNVNAVGPIILTLQQ